MKTIMAALRWTPESLLSPVASVLGHVDHNTCVCKTVLDRGSFIRRINFISLECMAANKVLWFLILEKNAIEMAENKTY